MRHAWFFLLLAFVVVGCSSAPTPPAADEAELRAAATTVTLSPTSYKTTRGVDGGQPVSNLTLRDQSGAQNTWTKYVEFQPPSERYFGYRSYTLDPSIDPASLTSLDVKANFLGPTQQAQAWRWRLYNWSSRSWEWLGDNSGAGWNAWTLLSFSAGGNLADYVSAAGEIRVRTDFKDVSDNADLDYEAVVVDYETQSTPPDGSWWKPQKGLSWWWQLENTSSLNTDLDVDVYDVDLFEGIDTGKIETLKNKGYRVICYFSAGTYEDFRPDSDALVKNDRIALIGGSSLPDFPDEAWLAIGDAQALDNVIEPVMRARLDLARSAGCDAVEPDNVDGYDNGETQGQISRAEQLSYNRWLASEAHLRGLSVGLKNATDLVATLENEFDFAVNEQCYAYDRECSVYEGSFLSANKSVFNQEYDAPAEEPDGSVTRAAYQGTACAYFQSRQIASLWKAGLNLSGQGVVQCQP